MITKSDHTEIPTDGLLAALTAKDELIADLRRQIRHLERHPPHHDTGNPCADHTCPYFTSYLAQGPGRHTHRSYHHDADYLSTIYQCANDWDELYPTAPDNPYTPIIQRYEAALRVQ